LKTLILAGGLGTRLVEETVVKPKPMVEIGGIPIISHVMEIYASQGHSDFLVALGYKGELIKKYFLEYSKLNSDLNINLGTGEHNYINKNTKDWNVGLIDTGYHTQTGGRVKRMSKFVGNETFFVTYSDGLANINLKKLIEFHRSHGKIATLTTVHPPSRFGKLELNENQVTKFAEKPTEGDGWINGGFYVFEPSIFEYINGDETVLEREPMERLVNDEQLMSYKHNGYWQMMDTLQEKQLLESQWNNGSAPWKKLL
jgi:glucose-1-phosphate cytidylyltransferase